MRRLLLAGAVAVGVLGVWAGPAGADHDDPSSGFPDEWGEWDANGNYTLDPDELDAMSQEDWEALRDWMRTGSDDEGIEDSGWRGWIEHYLDTDNWTGGDFDDVRTLLEIEDEGILDDNLLGTATDVIGAGRGDPEAMVGLGETFSDVPTPSSLAREAFDSIANSVGEAAGSLVGWVASELADTGTPSQLSADWYQRHYGRMLGWSGLIMVPLAMIAIGGAVVRGDTSRIGEILLQIPVAYLLGVVAIGLVSAAGGLAQTMAQTLAGDIADSSSAVAANVSGMLVVRGGLGAGMVLLLGLVIAIAALTTAVWLILTEAAIYGVVLFVPLAFAGKAWPDSQAATWGRRLLSLAFALVFAKVVIFALWALTVDGLAAATDAVSLAGGASDSDESVPLRSAIAVAALLVMTAASPAAVLRLVPMTEGGSAGAGAGGSAARNVRSAAQVAVGVAGRFGGGGSGAQLPVSHGSAAGRDAKPPPGPIGGGGSSGRASDPPGPVPDPKSKRDGNTGSGGESSGRRDGPGEGQPHDGGTRNRGAPGPSAPSPGQEPSGGGGGAGGSGSSSGFPSGLPPDRPPEQNPYVEGDR